MTRIIKLPVNDAPRKGYKRVKKSKRVNLEDHGQLNLFTQPTEARVVEMKSHKSDFELALQFDEEQDRERAIAYYWRAIKIQDCLADAYCNLGILFSENNEYPEAIDAFTQALKEEPRHLEAHYNLANAYSEIGNNKLALIHYELVLKIDSEFASAHYNLGLVLIQENRYQEAINSLRLYKQLITDDTSPIERLIDSLQKTIKHG